MGMGMSVSSQIWQQFIDLVFQDNLIKRKQNFDVIMDDTFKHLAADEHMDRYYKNMVLKYHHTNVNS